MFHYHLRSDMPRRRESALADDYEAIQRMLEHLDIHIERAQHYVDVHKLKIDKFVRQARRRNMPQSDFLHEYHELVEKAFFLKEQLALKQSARQLLHANSMGYEEEFDI